MKKNPYFNNDKKKKSIYIKGMFSLLELNSITWTNGETLRMNDKALYDSSHSPRREAKEANNANPLSPNTIWCLEITSGSFIYGTKREGKKNHLKGDWWVLQRDWGGGDFPPFFIQCITTFK